MLNDINTAIAAVSAIILFLFGLDNFSKEIQRVSGERLRKFLGNFTKHPIVGLFLGASITSIIQSSSATTVITIGLVNAGIISFKNSLGIIFGANVGTTVTAQLIAFKLTNFAPTLIILGFFLSFIKSRYSFIGKSLFYFGFVFFSLNLISSALGPLQSDQRLVSFLSSTQSIFLSVCVGALFTALVQSSSVTTGLAVILVQQQLLSLENAVPIIIGANIGTTITALIAMLNMDSAARKTALSHLIFNITSAILFLPLVYPMIHFFHGFSADVALANIHLVMNLMTSIIFVIFVTPFSKLIDRLVSSSHHLELPNVVFPKLDEDLDFEEIDQFLKDQRLIIFNFIKENYNLVTLSIETNYRNFYETVHKRNNYMEFLKSEFMTFFSSLINHVDNEKTSQVILHFMNQYEYLYQLHDSLKDFEQIKNHIDEMYIEIQSDGILHLREISSQTFSLFTTLAKSLVKEEISVDIKDELNKLQSTLNQTNKDLIKSIQNTERRDVGSLIHFFTYSQRLKDKMAMFYRLTKTP